MFIPKSKGLNERLRYYIPTYALQGEAEYYNAFRHVVGGHSLDPCLEESRSEVAKGVIDVSDALKNYLVRHKWLYLVSGPYTVAASTLILLLGMVAGLGNVDRFG